MRFVTCMFQKPVETNLFSDFYRKEKDLGEKDQSNLPHFTYHETYRAIQRKGF